jgi:phosphate transport system substrate-binding protein
MNGLPERRDKVRRSICLAGLVLSLLLGLVVLLLSASQAAAQERREQGTIRLSGAWALYPMAVKWAAVYEKDHPGVKVEVSAGGAGKGAADALSGLVDVGMVSRDIQPAEMERGGLGIPVVKDAVVAVVNEANPVLHDLLAKGMKREAFVRLWMKGDLKKWGEAVGTAVAEPIHVFTRSDSCGAAETWAQYLGGKQEDLKGIGIYGDPGIAEKVAGDKLGIGYNNLNFAYDPKTRKPIAGLVVVPIDVNDKGRIDEGERFYDTKDELLRAIADGRYPSPPARDLNFLTKGKPTGLVRDFVAWVLTEGQKYADEVGYVPLAEAHRREALKKLE